jgi:TP901 family phage tail tape measure protein
VTDRTVAARLRLEVSDYIANAGRAARATRSFADEARRGTAQVSRELQSVKTSATVAGAALLALPAAAAAVSMAFDKQMSNVRAVTGATADEMDRLRAAAITAGQATVFSAGDAAAAEAELAKAGIATSDILSGALRGSLDLAAAGNLDLAQAATISAQAMNTFSLGGRDVAHIADVLAAGANKSAADVGQLGDALRQGGLVADQTGLSLEDTVGVLSAFADKALIGSDAGTSLKTMLQRLTPQSKEAADTMAALGIRAYDAQGQFVGLDAFAQNLQDSLGKLTPEARNSAMAVIFGSDAVRGASILYDLGAKGVREYTGAVNDQGAASRMAGVQLDNLAGDLEQLKGSIETTLIQSGSEANGVLRDMTQAATGAVNFIGALPGPVLATGLAVTTLSGAFLVAAPRIADFNARLAASPGLAKAAAIGFKSLGAVSAIAIGAGVVLDIQAANEANDQLRDSINDLISQLSTSGFKTDLFDQLVEDYKRAQQQINDPGPWQKTKNVLEGLWTSLSPDSEGFTAEMARIDGVLTSSTARAADALGTLNSAVGNAAGTLGVSFDRALELANDSGITLADTSDEMTKKIVAYAASQATGSAATHTAAAAMGVLADKTTTAEDRLKAFKTAWDATVGVMLSSSDAEIAAEAAIDSLTASLAKNGRTWDINTEKGRSNQSAYNDVVAAAGRAAQAKLEEGKGVEVANATYDHYLRKLLKSKGLTDEQRAAVKLLISDGYAKLPATKTTKVTADTSQAVAALNSLGNLLDTTVGGVRLTVTASGDVNAHGTRKARGGQITGPGTGTSDSIPIMASNGEFVVNARATSANLGLLTAINAGAVAGYATGGRVSRRTKATSRAVDRVQQRGSEAHDYIAQARAGIMSQGSIAGFDFGSSAYTQALEDQKAALADIAQAQADVARAKLAADDARTPLERARALDRLAAASSDLADAQGRLADAQSTVKATEVSGRNLLASQAAKVKAAEAFAKDFAALRSAGLNEASLNEIRELGFVDGDMAAKALLSTVGGIAQANSNQKRLAKAASSIGDTAGLAKYGLTAGAAHGLMQVSIQGGVHVHIPASVRPADRALIREEVQDALEASFDQMANRKLTTKGKRP